jgi:uncharacterized protein YycO
VDTQFPQLAIADWRSYNSSVTAEPPSCVECARTRAVWTGTVAFLLVSSAAGCGRTAPGTLGYDFQRCICLAVADINFHQPCGVRTEQVALVDPALRSGDIVLRRRYGNLSNAFIPGFWTHAAIYLGTSADLASLGLHQRPELAEPLRRFAEPPPDGRPLRAIHAPAEGVVFTSLEDLFQADAILVLRPRLDDAGRAATLANALVRLGRPYDFDFDLQTDDRVTCTEFLWRAYGDLLDIKPVTVLGKETLTPNQIASGFVSARREGRPPKLDFVLLLMAEEPGEQAEFRAVEKLP